MVKAEYTKYLSGSAFKEFRLALLERKDNLPEKLLAENKSLIEKVSENPDVFLRSGEYGKLHEMATIMKKQWLSGTTIRIFFFGGNKKLNEKVLEVAREWCKYCSIKFEQVSNLEESTIRVSFKPGASWSYVGTDAKGVRMPDPTVNFGWLESADEPEFRRVVLHEFGHVLGLIHEHSSPAVKINWNKPYVFWYFSTFEGWDTATTIHNVIWQADEKESNFSTIDTKSIMAYYIPPEFTLDGKEVFPLNFDLSEMDKVHIAKIYS